MNALKQTGIKLTTLLVYSIKTRPQKPRLAFLFHSRWQNRKERPNRSTDNGDMYERAKRPVSDGVSSVTSM